MSLRNKLFVSFGTISLLLLAFVFVTVELRVREQVSGDTVAELQQTDAAFVEHWEFLRERLAATRRHCRRRPQTEGGGRHRRSRDHPTRRQRIAGDDRRRPVRSAEPAGTFVSAVR